MALNRVILYGRLVRDPDCRQTNSGLSVARFTIACDRPYADKQTGKREADFIEVQAWKNTADFLYRYFHNGDAITVEGALRNNNYEDKNGVKHYSYYVLAEQVGFGGRSEQQAQGNYQPAQPSQNAPQQRQQAAPQGLNFDDFTEIIGGNPPF